MKRSFVYLILALALSLLLCGCGNMTEEGNVASSPWPDVTTPVLPSPTAAVTATPIPGTYEGSAANATPVPDMSTSTPRPTE